MALEGPFCHQGNTFLITTSGTTLTPTSTTVSFFSPISSQPAAQAAGVATPAPPQFRLVAPAANTNTIYVSITNFARTAAVPGANPTLEFPVQPNEDLRFALNSFPLPPNYVLFINVISVGTSQLLNVSFGEGR